MLIFRSNPCVGVVNKLCSEPFTTLRNEEIYNYHGKEEQNDVLHLVSIHEKWNAFSSGESTTRKMEDRVLTVLSTMLRDRGYTFDSPELLGNPLTDTKMFNLGGALIIFSEKTRVSKKELQNYIAFAAENGYTNGTIIVSNILPSDDVLSVVRRHIADRNNPMLQVFAINHVKTDHLKTHRKALPHRVLPDDEKAEIEKRFKELTRLPPIDCLDAAVKWVGGRPGDVIEVIEPSPSAGTTTYWCYCVEDYRRAR